MTINLDTEAAHQRAYVKWAKLYGIFPYLIVGLAGGLRDKAVAVQLKLQGSQPGIPDLFLAIPNKTYHGLFIELKKPKVGRLTIDQKEFLRRLGEKGYAAHVAYGWEEAKQITEKYLKQGSIKNAHH